MTETASGSIPVVVDQHVEEAAGLYTRRVASTHAPYVTLQTLRRADERLAAHLDGIAIAGVYGRSSLETALDSKSAGAMFTAAVCALQVADKTFLDDLFLRAEQVREDANELISALGWVSAGDLKGLAVTLLGSSKPFQRQAGIAACAMHRVDPGIVSERRLEDPNPEVRARALRTSGEIGCVGAAPACAVAVRHDDPECRFWAARSAVLLENRGTALEMLASAGLATGPHRRRAFRLALQAMSPSAAHEVLRQLAKDPAQLRWLIQGSGIAGDSVYVPWLIKHMTDENTARLAGEAFSLITGVDLADSTLEAEQPTDFESGPNDDPEDPNVDMDPDEGLPWPDPRRIETWWAANAGRFQPGARYFVGAPVTREHCVDVLKNGYQRQRVLAAHYLCLLEPGTPLFNTSAPAWRQQRLLAKMA